MRDEFEILKPNIFPENKIISGVTKRNRDLFPETGFSISNGNILTDEQVSKHRKYLSDYLGYDLENLKFQKQVHKTDIQIVNKDTPSGIETDGMITNEKGIILNITIADCTAILVYDPLKKGVGAFHSGWRGTKENIA
ncbi:laccase domain-containing protein, partial [Bacteroidota bacterium]